MAVWLVAASPCVVAGHAPVRKSGTADRETLAALFNRLSTTSPRPSSSNSGTGSDLPVPIIPTASGASNSCYTSKLTLTNRGSHRATLRYTCRAAAGGGNRIASETPAPGRQIAVPNAIDCLQTLGSPPPNSGNRIGTPRVPEAVDSKTELQVMGLAARANPGPVTSL